MNFLLTSFQFTLLCILVLLRQCESDHEVGGVLQTIVTCSKHVTVIYSSNHRELQPPLEKPKIYERAS